MNWFLFFFSSASWGGSFIAIRFMLEGMPPLAAAGSRTLLAALLMAGLAVVQKARPPRGKKLFGKMIGLGMINFAVPWACLFWGEQFVQPAIASILNSTSPLFVFLFSYWLLADEQPTWLRFAGVMLGFLGILSVFGPSVSGFSSDPHSLFGMLGIVLMAMGYGLGAVLMKRMGNEVDIRWNIAVQCVAATAVLFSFSAAFESRGWVGTAWSHPKVVWSLLYLSILSTVIGWLIYFHLLRIWGALRASATTYVVPFVAVFLDWIWLQKFPTTAELIGGALIIGAVALIHGSRARPKRPSCRGEEIRLG